MSTGMPAAQIRGECSVWALDSCHLRFPDPRRRRHPARSLRPPSCSCCSHAQGISDLPRSSVAGRFDEECPARLYRWAVLPSQRLSAPAQRDPRARPQRSAALVAHTEITRRPVIDRLRASHWRATPTASIPRYESCPRVPPIPLRLISAPSPPRLAVWSKDVKCLSPPSRHSTRDRCDCSRRSVDDRTRGEGRMCGQLPLRTLINRCPSPLLSPRFAALLCALPT